MADLTNTKPKDTYGGLLQVPNSNLGVDATLRTVQDGKGNSTPLKLSTTAVGVGSIADVEAYVTTLTSVSVTGTIVLDSTAFGKLHVVTGTSADYTIGLPTAVGNTGKTLSFQFSTALTKLITLDGNASETINGTTTRPYWAGETITLISNGTNYTIVNYTANPMVSSMTKSSQSVAYNSTVKIILDTVNLDNTGFCANTSNGRIDIKRTGTYLMKCRTQSSAIVALTTDIIQTFYKNGSNTATTGGPSGIAANLPFFMFNEGIAISLTAGDYIEINIFHDTTGSIARTFTCSLTVLEII